MMAQRAQKDGKSSRPEAAHSTSDLTVKMSPRLNLNVGMIKAVS